MEQLIPGLPDDVAIDCLARIPLRHHPGLRPVCRRWRHLLSSTNFAAHRRRIGTAEDVIFLVQALGDASKDVVDEDSNSKVGITDRSRAPVYALSAYNATTGEWARGSPSVPMFAHCAAAGSRVVVVGGWDPATYAPMRGVSVLDPRTGTWRAGKEMPEPARSLFACSAGGGRVYVSGGHDDGKNALRCAAAYDPVSDEWEAMPEMGEERDECQGLLVAGRFMALSGYGTERQGRFGTSSESYDPVEGRWVRDEENIWGDEQQRGGGATSCFAWEGKVYYIDCSDGGRRGLRVWEKEGWRTVAPAPEAMKPGACCVPVGGGKVFVMGAADGHALGGHCGWILDVVGSWKWAQLETPASFSGFVYSATALRL